MESIQDGVKLLIDIGNGLGQVLRIFFGGLSQHPTPFLEHGSVNLADSVLPTPLHTDFPAQTFQGNPPLLVIMITIRQ